MFFFTILLLCYYYGFTETVLTPLQVNSVLYQANRRRAALDPPLPPITVDQIQCGELSALLEEDDYNLAAVVNIELYTQLYTNYLDYYLSSESLVSSFYPLNSNLYSICFAPISSCGLLCTFLYILCNMYMHTPASNLLECYSIIWTIQIS